MTDKSVPITERCFNLTPAPSAASGLAQEITSFLYNLDAATPEHPRTQQLADCRDRLRVALSSSLPAQDRDAERYRWLRARPSLIGWDWWPTKVSRRTDISPEFMDYAIDAAMSQQEGK